MSRKGRFQALLTGAVFLLAMGGAVAEETEHGSNDLNKTVNQIRNNAAKVDAASGAEKARAEKALLDAVKQAIAAAKNTDEVNKIIDAAVTAAPMQAAEIASAAVAAAPALAPEIVGTAIQAAPSQAAEITQAAVAAAPTQAVAITVAALAAAPDQAKSIINSAMTVAPNDSTTVSELRSLSTRSQNAITHDNNMPNQTPPASGGRNTASPA